SMPSSRASSARARRTAAIRVTVGVVVVLVGAAALLGASEGSALARPGGGSSYSGGSRSSSRSSSGSGSSSGGGGGFVLDLFLFLIRLCITAPAIGVPLVLVLVGVVVAFAIAKKRNGALHSWSVGVPGGDGSGDDDDARPSAAPRARAASGSAHVSARARLEGLRRYDENFSLVLFEDFVAALYVEVQHARGARALDKLTAYVSEAARATFGSQGVLGVRDVLVGAMRVVSVDLGPNDASPDARIAVDVELETNFTELRDGGREQAFYAHERWRLVRRRGARSRAPDKTRVFPCPSCGAPQAHVIAGVCRHCGQNVATGAFDWVLERMTLVACETRGPMLTATTEEVGNDFPTVVDKDAQARLRALSARDPAFDYMAFEARAKLVYASFQTGWANRDLAPMRPYFTDNLFQVQAYWIEAYTRQRLRNVTERARITAIHLARVTSDKFFDAITVRVFATSLDYTVTDEGKLVAGSKSRERAYTEYWTFIRAAGRKGPSHVDPACPNCGAPLAISMAGVCTYCSAKVTSGEFDWVLSRIEQDDSYEG
ncbi:Tim44 domain-containing protein, partial [bacterium]